MRGRRRCRRPAGKRPISNRCFVAFVSLVLISVHPVLCHARDLTEAEALRRGLARPALAELERGEVELARGEAIEAGLWPNPRAAYSREETRGGAAASVEDYVWLSQPLDVGGRRRLRRRAGERRAEAAADQNAARRIEVAAEIRLRFHETLLAQRRVETLEGWSRQIARIAKIVARREKAGEVSGYDRRRVERERASAVARLRTERATLDRARERLAALLGMDLAEAEALRIDAVLLPTDALPPVDVLLTALAERPDLRALERALAAAELEASAAARWWVPEVEVTGGVKTVEVANGRSDGFLAGVSIPLPLLDRNQGEAARAQSRARIARAQRALELERSTGEVRGLWREAGEVAAAAREFRQEAIAASAELGRTAEAAYEGSEMELLELLDAHRTALDASMQALELEMRARTVRIELDRASGRDL